MASLLSKQPSLLSASTSSRCKTSVALAPRCIVPRPLSSTSSSSSSNASASSARSVVTRVAFVDARQMERRSVDPVTESWSTEEHVPGQIWTMHSPQQLDAALAAHAGGLCVLMCKSKTCRPCKAFLKKYAAIAERFPRLVAMQILGDESAETRKLMMSMKVKVTPTFMIYRGGERAATVTGVSETKLLRALVDLMTPEELAGHEEDVFELEAAEREEAAAGGEGA